MKIIALVLAVMLASFPAFAQDQAPAQTQQPAAPAAAPKCDRGPVHKNFGDTPWLVYSCDDDRTVVIIAAQDNPAKPFYFTFAPDAGHYRLHGEGTGDREATKAAFSELKALSKQDLQALIDQTKTAAAN